MSTGYEVTFRDFGRLLPDPEWRVPVAPLVSAWLGCEVVPAADGVILRGRDGTLIPLGEAHAAIEADPTRQYELYQTAMNLWR